MPSYDRSKLHRLLEQRHSARLHLRDMSERLRESISDMERAKSAMREGVHGSRSACGFLDQLLALPLAEAESLTVDQVQGYERRVGNQTETKFTGINFGTWGGYLDARRKKERLAQQVDSARVDFDERFVIVSRLCEAVRSWGFTNPELEI